MAQPDARTLEIFRAVAATGSATRAAERLNTTQPNVTRAIGAFEKECGFVLFERGRYGMTLTPAGRELLGVVERNWAGLQTIGQAMSELRTGPPGTLYAITVPYLAEGAFADLLGDYARAHPHVSLNIRIQAPDQVVSEVETGGADIGMLFGPPPLGTSASALPAGESRMGLAVPAHHRLANRKSVHFTELDGERMVMILPPHQLRFAAEAAMANLGVRPSLVHEVATQRTLIELVRRSDAVGFADLDLILAERAGSVVAVELEPTASWPVTLVYTGNRTHSRMLDAFLEWLGRRNGG